MEEKILIAYFAPKGAQDPKSLKISEKIAELLKEKGYESTQYAITPVETYPADKAEFEAVTKVEKETRTRPALIDKVGKFHDYKKIVLVAPNWWNDFPMAIYTFLDDYDFSGKRVVPVIYHGGDGYKHMVDALRDFIHKVWVTDGVGVNSDSVCCSCMSNVLTQLFETSKN